MKYGYTLLGYNINREGKLNTYPSFCHNHPPIFRSGLDAQHAAEQEARTVYAEECKHKHVIHVTKAGQ